MFRFLIISQSSTSFLFACAFRTGKNSFAASYFISIYYFYSKCVIKFIFLLIQLLNRFSFSCTFIFFVRGADHKMQLLNNILLAVIKYSFCEYVFAAILTKKTQRESVALFCSLRKFAVIANG